MMNGFIERDVFGSPNYNNQDLIELELSKIIYCMFYSVVMLNDLTLKIYMPFMIAVSIIEIVLQSIDIPVANNMIIIN